MIFPTLQQAAILAAAFAPLAAAAPLAPNLKIINPFAAETIPNSYIVVYKKSINATRAEANMAEVNSFITKRGAGHKGIQAAYDIGNFKGFHVEADATTLAQIAASDDVDFVEMDQVMRASALTSQTGAPYGLGRVSHRSPGSTTYIYDTTAGSGVSVYVVDTGIYTGHQQFGGRATFGANYISGSPNTDENGHGTHCAGTVGSNAYGVAKASRLVAVKVLGADGSGSNSGVISGINYVGSNAPARSVLSMSLGGGFSQATNNAVENTVARGVTVVVAAGNSNANAANFSPASAPNAITVGATDSSDNRASFSNFGSVLDIFAPGVNILSTWIGSPTATNTISGTSMACPHVAGLAAYLIALEGLGSPAAVVGRLRNLATTGVVRNPGSGSPNVLAYNGNGA